MSGRGTLDDAELRRTLDAVLSGAASASRRTVPADPPSGEPPTGVPQGSVADPPPRSGPDPAQRDIAAERWIVGRGGLAVLGLVLVAIGATLLAGTLGVLALDAGRLADYWPVVFVVIGLAVLIEAWAPGRRAEPREPAGSGAVAPGVSGIADADELERRLDRVLASRQAEAPPPVSAAPPPEPPRPRPAATVPRHGDLVAALLELQGLRRHRLISKRQYRAKRAELVARMTPSLASRGWDEPGAAEETEATDGAGMDAGAHPLPGYRGPTAA